MNVVEPPIRKLTRADLERLPDKERAGMELVDGRPVDKHAVGMTSAWVATRIAYLLKSQVPATFGHVMNVALIYPFGEEENARRPDVCFIRAGELPGGIRDGDPIVVPDLVVAVRSPSELPREAMTRIHRYLDAGVPMIWHVNTDERRVDLLRGDGTTQAFEHDMEITGDAVLPMFRCEDCEFFPPAVVAG